MSNTPRHCEIAIEYFTLAKELGSYEEANKHFQYLKEDGRWITGWSEYAVIDVRSSREYRRKPETHIVNCHEVPAPYRKKPEFHTLFYFVRFNSFGVDTWGNTAHDLECFNSSNCFKSESDAEENRLAMFKTGKYAEVKV